VITHFEATMALLSAAVGMLVTLIVSVWKARGWVDRLNTTDGRLADAIETLASAQREQHAENRERFTAIERRLEGRPRARRPSSA
jgi:hypothetical protein